MQPHSTSAYVGTSADFSALAAGSSPLSYQWRSRTPGQDPVPIATATNRTLTLTNIQLGSAGTYDVVVSNAFGTNVSVGARLIAVDAPPFITQPPANSAVTRGFAASLSVGVEGSRPLTYQWQRNGTDVPGGAGPSLVHSSAQPSNSGIYQVIVTNHLGAVTSAPVVLEVTPVLNWYRNYYRYGTLPLGITNAIAVDSGRAHNIVLTADGRAVSWGSYIMFSSPQPNDLANIVGIAAGYDHNLALRSDGTVAGWGSDYSYESIRVGQATPPAGLSNVVAVRGGSWHSLALKKDGMVVGWGYGGGFVPGGLTNIIAISAGEFHSLFLRADGTVVAAGNNTDGQVSVPAGLTNVVAIEAEYYFSMALQADGHVVCWGTQPSPGSSVNRAVAISGGPYALNVDGTVVAWGSGVLPNPPPTGVVAIGASAYSALFLLGDGINAAGFGLSTPQLSDGAFSVAVPTTPNRPYILQSCDSLEGANWISVTGVAGDGTTQTLKDPRPPAGQRFYRVFR